MGASSTLSLGRPKYLVPTFSILLSFIRNHQARQWLRGASVSPHRSRPHPSSGGVKRIDEMLLGGKAWSTSRLSRDQENHAENIDKQWRVRKDNSNVSLFRIILIPELYTQPSVGMDRHQQAFLRGWHCAHFLRPSQLETTYSRLLICRPMMMIIYSWQCKSWFDCMRNR